MNRRGSALVAVTVLLSGCGGGQPAATSSFSTATPTTTTTTTTSTSDGPTPQTSNGQQYSVTTTTIEGDSDDGRGSWKSEFHQLAGGDPAVVQAFNGASQAAAMDQVEAAKNDASTGTTTWTFEGRSQISFRPVAVAQVVYGSLYYGAHPSQQIGTIVIDSRSADPVMLVDLFTDPQAGLTAIAEQTRASLAEDGLDVPVDLPGAAPKAENFANWIPTAEGLEFHFDEYQFGPRLPAVVTVPWSAVAPLMAATMADFSR